MRPLLLLAVLAFPPAVHADAPIPPVQADWRRDAGVDDRVKTALTGKGWRFEADGRALDPKTKAPVSKPVLEKTVMDLRQDARRSALETVNALMTSGKPLEIGDVARIKALSEDLPPGLVAAALDPNSDVNKVKAMADADLATVAAYFEGGRTMADREAAAQPVAAGAPGPRVDLPYYTAREKSVGEKLNASIQAEIGRDPFGRTVLARLDAAGKPSLPPIVIEELGGQVLAQYDYRRGAIALDREVVLGSVLSTVPPARRSALRTALEDRASLMSYLDNNPAALAAVVKDGDAVIVHELTHAWQDRRDPVFREMARGNLPDVQPLEYEEEAYATKNLYIQSKIKNDPASVRMDMEFKNYVLMSHGVDSWRAQLFDDVVAGSPSRALGLKSVAAVQRERLAKARARTVSTADEQKAKALDLLALKRGEKELLDLQAAHAARMKPINDAIALGMSGRSEFLGTFYLGRALSTPGAVDRSVLLDQAERYAKASRNATLIEEVRKAKASQ